MLDGVPGELPLVLGSLIHQHGVRELQVLALRFSLLAQKLPLRLDHFSGSLIQMHYKEFSVLLRAYHQPSLGRSEEHTSELQSRFDLVCRLLIEKKKYNLHKIKPLNK